MISLACLFLLAASSHLELFDEVYTIPAGEWRYVPVTLNQPPVLLSARFEVRSGSSDIRLALLRSADLRRLRRDEPHGLLSVTGTGSNGILQYPIQEPGDYALVVDNRASPGLSPQPATVHLAVSLDFRRTGPVVGALSGERRLAVIAISFVGFFLIAGFSARRLLRAMRP
jgi:hypothetical protein